MPELPEVETVRRGLQPHVEGAFIERVEQRRPDLRFPLPERFVERLSGRTVTAIGRRAKYLTMHLDDGLSVISHLGMSGSWRVEMGGDAVVPGEFHYERSKAEAHDHIVFHLHKPDGERGRIVFNDPRRFGFLLFAEDGLLNDHPSLASLGVEPTGNVLDAELVSALFRDKRAPLKAALLDQRLIAGLGNIYVCEALWRAGLSPTKLAGAISGPVGKPGVHAERLATSIREVIADAIEAGGSSLRDYVHADGSLGYFQHSFSVYDREGEPCPRAGCGGTVQRIVQSGRSTFFCEGCQT